ncbi:toxin extrusion protein 1 [Seminavis robusta]|uniref:Toxin extrusion protein 1 n=1 Tax=Seminavis robusta TaxID=568900 RepID=A0A9N8D953_9STRA|nr:toxin extrusion protein 1 [Seminavis robusta]|eukprot:Sro47_g027780.1 toxin extrusion protein 1 (534) ;mRNA; r:59147-60922
MTRLSFGASDGAVEEAIHSNIPTENLSPHATSEDENCDQINGSYKQANDDGFHFLHEASMLLNIALPSVVTQLSVLFVFPQTASAVGLEFGTEELAGFSLGSLVGNLTCLSVMVGALTAADTLMPRAFANGRDAEMGRLAIRGFVMCCLLLIPPIIPLCTMMESIFDALGQSPVAASLASKWIRIYLLGVPAMLIFRCLQSFLNAQHQVMPLVVGSTVACFVIHPAFLKLLLPTMGFEGSALAISLTQYAMAMIVLVYLLAKPVHKSETWPGLSWEYIQEAIRLEPVLQFLSLSLGGVLSLSEWWFWATVCFIVGSFGIVPLCVHTIAYNLVPLLFMIPLGISIGLTVRMGNAISTNVKKAKIMAAWCMAFTVVVGAVVAILLFHFRVAIARLFSDDPEVIQGCQDIWPKLCYYVFMLYIFGINSAIHRALGLQWRMAAIIFVCLWLFTLPTIVVVAIWNRGGLDAVWSILPCFYTLMQILLALSYLTLDWDQIAKQIREKEVENMLLEGHAQTKAKKDQLPNEDTPLLYSSC